MKIEVSQGGLIGFFGGDNCLAKGGEGRREKGSKKKKGAKERNGKRGHKTRILF